MGFAGAPHAHPPRRGGLFALSPVPPLLPTVCCRTAPESCPRFSILCTLRGDFSSGTCTPVIPTFPSPVTICSPRLGHPVPMSGFMFNGHLRINLGKIALFSLKAMLAQPIIAIWSFTQAGNLGITLTPRPLPVSLSHRSVRLALLQDLRAVPVSPRPSLPTQHRLSLLSRPWLVPCSRLASLPCISLKVTRGQKVLRNQILFPVAPIVCGINDPTLPVLPPVCLPGFSLLPLSLF